MLTIGFYNMARSYNDSQGLTGHMRMFDMANTYWLIFITPILNAWSANISPDFQAEDGRAVLAGGGELDQ